uniref:Hypothetical conserved protein n=1 Tax=Glossina morsitans morsitans TaxID=37546 RepID=D3TNF9_GLOMM
MDYLDYAWIVWSYIPYMLYAFVFFTLVPKSIRRIVEFANANYEANRHKYHRCYAPDICCHSFDPELLPKQKARKTVTRIYPKKQSISEQSSPSTKRNSVTEESPNIYKRQVHTHTNVNKIAKMFESGGVQKKINRVTPTTILTNDLRKLSVDTEDFDNCFKREDTANAKKRKDSFVKLNNEEHLRKRFSQLSEDFEENNENSANVLNQLTRNDSNELWRQNWRSEPIAVQRRSRNVPNNLTFAGTSATPSTVSPSQLSPLSSPPSSDSPLTMSPTQPNASLLNAMQSSLEDIFAAIARNAEETECFLYKGCRTLSPVTSIDDILSQRRLSRPLSAYSISDLLNDEPNSNNTSGLTDTYVENFCKILNKT